MEKLNNFMQIQARHLFPLMQKQIGTLTKWKCVEDHNKGVGTSANILQGVLPRQTFSSNLTSNPGSEDEEELAFGGVVGLGGLELKPLEYPRQSTHLKKCQIKVYVRHTNMASSTYARGKSNGANHPDRVQVAELTRLRGLDFRYQ